MSTRIAAVTTTRIGAVSQDDVMVAIEGWALGHVLVLAARIGVGAVAARNPGSELALGSCDGLDFRIQNSEFRIQNSEFKIQISDFRFQISDYGFWISDVRFRILM